MRWLRTGAVYTTFSYDAVGQRTSQVDGASKRTSFVWDAAGRLHAVQLPTPSPSSTAGTIHTFSNGHDGLRRGHQGPNHDGDVLLWDEAAGLADPLALRGTGGTGSTSTHLYELFVQEPGAGEASPHLVRALGVSRQGLAVSHTYHADRQGTTQVTSGEGFGAGSGTGNTGTATFTFDAWGNRLSPVASSGQATRSEESFLHGGGLGYWSEPNLQEAGLTYVRQRWLENATGQWLSPDAIEAVKRHLDLSRFAPF